MEFLRYPHLITTLFNGCVFGPPRDFTHASSWTRIGHPVSGLQLPTMRPIKTWFPFGSAAEPLNLAGNCNSPDRSTKSTLSRCRHKCRSLQLLVNIGFQVLFHSPPGVLFTFPSLYCFTIGHQVVFRLGGWSLRIPTRFHVSRGTQDTARCSRISCTGLSPSLAGFPNTVLLSLNNAKCSPTTPNHRSDSVWPLSRSLAATRKITFVFSSCGYLDVSVPRVPSVTLWIHVTVTGLFPAGFPHSEICGSMAICA